ncbi:MAG: MFS transporter [Nitrospiraceae bacterium]|nr:MFS transporter [Nitrospiraceae bacterium]
MPGLSAPQRFSALTHRDFRLFLIGQTISLSGTWMQSVAQGWLVYSLTRSPLYLGIVAAAGALPIMLFTLAGGLIADRYPKKKLLLLTQAASIFPALALGILTRMGTVTVWQIAFVAFVLGTINAIDIPVRQSFLIEMVGRGDIVNAVALNSAVFNGSRVIGPVIAGFSITQFGMPACFFINAFSFIAVLVALWMMETEGRTTIQSEGPVSDFMKGIGFIRSRTEILQVIVMIAVFSLVGIPYINLIPVFAGEVFHAGPRGLGYLVGASGLGALTAALGIAAAGNIRKKTRFMSLAALSFSAALILFSVSGIFWVSLIVIAIGGWGMVSYLATANSYIQLSVPDELRGRVMSVYSFVFLGFVPIGNSLMGLAANFAGTREAVFSGGVICLLASWFFSRKLRMPEGES